jgi:hypothetical protein
MDMDMLNMECVVLHSDISDPRASCTSFPLSHYTVLLIHHFVTAEHVDLPLAFILRV